MMSIEEEQENKQLELTLLLEAIYLKSGYDFRKYSRSHLNRRLDHVRKRCGMTSYCNVIHRLIYDAVFLNEVLGALSINVSEMFRDPFVYNTIRNVVIPHLKTFPHIKVWHAGCAAGQEVYSMAILLKEEGMLERTQLYGTDLNDGTLDTAQKAIYPTNVVREYTKNYQESGGKSSFADYYTSAYDSVTIATSIKENILFSQHNLVTDGIFGEMHMICCRNVLIYFTEELQHHVIKLFYDSLRHGGFLCLGTKETLRFSNFEDDFEVIDEKASIYRKRSVKDYTQREIL